MKIYHIDLGWQGSLTTIATSRKEAIKTLIKDTVNGKYVSQIEWDQDLEEFKIEKGLVIEHLGDS